MLRFAAFVLRALQFEGLLACEHLEDLAHRLRAVAGLGGVFQSEAIRFHLVLAAVALHPGLRADVGELRHRVRAGHDGRAGRQHASEARRASAVAPGGAR